VIRRGRGYSLAGEALRDDAAWRAEPLGRRCRRLYSQTTCQQGEFKLKIFRLWRRVDLRQPAAANRPPGDVGTGVGSCLPSLLS